MKNKYILSSFIFLSIFLIACKSTLQNSTQSLQNPEKGLLWKIEGKGIKKPSYLFGTIHLIKSDDYFLPDGFNEAFDQSENVVFEIDMSQLDDMNEIMSLLPKVIMKDELSLSDLITAEEYDKVNQFFNDAGIPLIFLERIKPLFLTMFADTDIKPGVIESGVYKSYEMEFQKLAVEKGKKVMGLETIDYQINILDSIPYEEQARMLVKSLDQSKTEIPVMDTLIKMYKEQNISGMHKSIQTDEISKYEKILLNDRNENWIPVMSGIMKENTSFFAVGAGHLGGENGVINLLRKSGFKVTPVLKQNK